MVSQSRLYLALLAIMATMAFWLGLWCSAVSNYEDFREPKPIAAADEVIFVDVAKKPVSQNFNRNIKESYLVNPSPPSTLQKAKRRKWFREKYSSKNNKNYKNQDVGIPYPFRKPKKHTQTGTGTKPETEAKIKSSFGSQKITHSHSEPANINGGAGTKTKSSFGSHGKTPVVKSLFSFGSMKPGAKINPFTYGSKLIGYRLVMEEKNQNSDMFKVPKTIVEIPKNNEAKWKTAPEYQITNKIPIESARNILIMTSWRFGSTFLGDLLNHYPGVFYSFEPLHYLSRKASDEHSGPFKTEDALNLTRDIYNCDFNSGKMITGYLKHASKSENQFLLKHNFRVWNSCAALLPSSVACFMPELQKNSCQQFPIRLIKMVRLRVEHAQELLKEPDLNLKIIVLVRDPRGVMRSRRGGAIAKWCDKSACSETKRMCSDMDSDVTFANELAQEFSNRITMIRYEDLSTKPYQTVDKLINFLDLPPNSKFIDSYLESHTGKLRHHEMTTKSTVQLPKGGKELPFGTKRKSSEETAFKWMDSLSEKEIQDIEEVCMDPMKKLGYAPYDSDILDHKDILVKSASDIWPY